MVNNLGSKPGRLRPSGGYRGLRAFGAATMVYDATVSFCARFLDKRSRTVDQMVQAARSGRQNIAEGSRASAVSSRSELKLVNVARASLDELLLDYEDFLRQRGLKQWGKDDPRALEVRGVWKELKRDRTDRSDQSDQSDWPYYSQWLDREDSAMVANAIICLIHQTNYLLDRLLQELERRYKEEGNHQEQPVVAGPKCPTCGKIMILRQVRRGKLAGKQFWGCSDYPACKGTRELEGSD